VFKRLSGPVLASPTLSVVDGKGRPAPGRVSDLLPAGLPDLFEDDQLVLLGRYAGARPLGFVLSGNYLGLSRSFGFQFNLDDATAMNSFVPRLWASRKIGALVDEIRQSGADVHGAGAGVAGDPRTRELVEEVVRLSREFGILTEYTSFLAMEGTDLSNKDQVLAQASRNFNDRAVNTRSGMGAVNQSVNANFMAGQAVMNLGNAYVDENLNRVSVANVQQVNDLAFFGNNGRWVDSRVAGDARAAKPVRTVEFGSPEYRRIMDRLARENRQGVFMLRGDVIVRVDGETVLIKAPAHP
jgi:Ca-activated chloride channel family protein